MQATPVMGVMGKYASVDYGSVAQLTRTADLLKNRAKMLRPGIGLPLTPAKP
jgi:hypothetical protein